MALRPRRRADLPLRDSQRPGRPVPRRARLMVQIKVRAGGKEGPKVDRRASKDSAKEAKGTILAMVRMGQTIEYGCKQAARSRSAYDYYRKTDPVFREAIDLELRKRGE